MESEGEFIKRIQQQVTWEREHTIVGFGHTFAVPIEEIKDWIDEAKKEVPPILKNRVGKPWVNPEKAAEWFLKWLGTLEKT